MAFLQRCSKHLLEEQRQKINAYSIATAKLSALVFSALGGKNNKVKLEDFLPFETSKKEGELQESTIAALKWALKNENIPPSIAGLIGAELG